MNLIHIRESKRIHDGILIHLNRQWKWKEIIIIIFAIFLHYTNVNFSSVYFLNWYSDLFIQFSFFIFNFFAWNFFNCFRLFLNIQNISIGFVLVYSYEGDILFWIWSDTERPDIFDPKFMHITAMKVHWPGSCVRCPFINAIFSSHFRSIYGIIFSAFPFLTQMWWL